uniref:G-protein coupled receptors family 1 profile domain-containing protein n=1 Tax=Strongyloides stercoralis TaxID=6248 RepID=A0A0K0EE40_STRER
MAHNSNSTISITTNTLNLISTTTTSLLNHLTTNNLNNSSQVIRTECFINISKDERFDLIKQRYLAKLEDIFRNYYGWMPLPFTIIATALTLIFLISTYRAIKQQRVSRKCYALLFNRSIGDLICCISNFAVIGYCLLAPKVNRDVVPAIDTFFIGSFWAGMVSYVSLSLLKLYAVSKPFSYRNKVTMRKVIYLIMLTFVKVPYLNMLTKCRMETCLRTMYRSRNFLTIIVYFFTLFIFFGTLLYVRKARNFVNSFSKKNSNNKQVMSTRFPFWKLSLNVATFAVMNGIYVIWAILLQLNTDQCYFQKHLNQMMMYLGFVRLSLIIRICFDPILTFITDFQMRRSLYNVLGINGKINPLSSQKNMIKKGDEEIEDDINSSEYLERGKTSTALTSTTDQTNEITLKPKNDNEVVSTTAMVHESPQEDVIEVVKDEDLSDAIKNNKNM